MNKEKLTKENLTSLSEDESKELLSEMLTLGDDELTECINTIVDGIEYKDADKESIDDLSVVYKVIFNDDRVKGIMEKLLEEYDKESC